MHGVQPIAKIAPSPNEASQPPPRAHDSAAEPVADARTATAPRRAPIVPVAVASDPAAPASSGRQVRSSAGDVQQPGEVEAEHDQHDAADRPQGRQVVDQRTAQRTSR